MADLCRKYPHEIKVIYVSVDTEEKHYVAATRNQVRRASDPAMAVDGME